MPPPELPTDAPILDVPHPGKVGVFPLLGHELDVTLFHGSNGGPCQFFRIDIPLGREPWLNHNP